MSPVLNVWRKTIRNWVRYGAKCVYLPQWGESTDVLCCNSKKIHPLKSMGDGRRFWPFWINSVHSARRVGFFFLQTYRFWIYKKSGSGINTKFVKLPNIPAEWTEFIQKDQNLLHSPIDFNGWCFLIFLVMFCALMLLMGHIIIETDEN